MFQIKRIDNEGLEKIYKKIDGQATRLHRDFKIS
jgi:hypothetical protein